MAKFNLLMIGFLVMLAFAISPIHAKGGIDHLSTAGLGDEFYGNHQTVLDNCQTDICKIIKNNYPAYLAGLGAPDVTVPYYYTNFDNYQSTHAWLMADECVKQAPNDHVKAECYGMMVHYAGDIPFHTWLVPKQIQKNWWCFDWLCHPVMEMVIESDKISARQSSVGLMAAWTDDDTKFFNKLTGKHLDNEIALLKDVYGTTNFYSGGYGSGSNTCNSNVFWISTVLGIIAVVGFIMSWLKKSRFYFVGSIILMIIIVAIMALNMNNMSCSWKYEGYKLAIQATGNPVFRMWFYSASSPETQQAYSMEEENLKVIFNGGKLYSKDPTGRVEIAQADSLFGSPAIKVGVMLAFFILSVIGTVLGITRAVKWIVGRLRRMAGVDK